MLSDFYLGEKIHAIEEGLQNSIYFHKKKACKTRSDIWLKFDEIFSQENLKVDYFYFCTQCEQVIENISNDGNINRLKRHKCKDGIDDNNVSKRNPICKADRENLTNASVNFVSKDFRPFYVVEGKGYYDMCFACMEFGKKNRQATRDDLINHLPSRNTVKEACNIKADNTRKLIANLMKQAIKSGGLAATTDTWTDDFRHNTYIAVVAHMCIKQKDHIEYYRFNLSVSEITEIVKSGIREILNQ